MARLIYLDMIELIKAISLGAIQGVSEFLPISSTGHLILVEHWLGISQENFGLAFDAALHLGTLVAIIWYFQKDWFELFGSLTRYIDISNRRRRKIDYSDKEKLKLVKLLVIGTIPAIILGLLLEKTIESVFRSPSLIGAMLVIFSAVLIYAEKFGQRKKTIEKLGLIDAVVIGLAQSVALIPGVSRSGITLAAGMQRQLTRSEAARFAFLLSAPVVAGAGTKHFLGIIGLYFNQQIDLPVIVFFLTGMISAMVSGYLTIKYFLKYISSYSLYPFIIYRVILGLLILVS